jgi:superoxide reductase
VLHGGEGELVCCGKPMILFEAKTEDKGQEKHVPVIEKTADGVKVKVGDVPHPMEDQHYIEWIEIMDGDNHHRHFLKPGDDPEAFFPGATNVVKAREYCNVHGLWKTSG